jgi:hypothetical protein
MCSGRNTKEVEALCLLAVSWTVVAFQRDRRRGQRTTLLAGVRRAPRLRLPKELRLIVILLHRMPPRCRHDVFQHDTQSEDDCFHEVPGFVGLIDDAVRLKWI